MLVGTYYLYTGYSPNTYIYIILCRYILSTGINYKFSQLNCYDIIISQANNKKKINGLFKILNIT
jgi:hypothetical protein